MVPSLDQFKQLISAIRQSDGKKDNQEKSQDGANLVEFLAYSGARIGEVVGGGDADERRPMRWNDVHFERGTIFLPGTKTEAAPRTIPMSERLRVFPGALPAAKPAQQRTGLQRVNERAGGGELLNPMSAIEVVVKG